MFIPFLYIYIYMQIYMLPQTNIVTQSFKGRRSWRETSSRTITNQGKKKDDVKVFRGTEVIILISELWKKDHSGKRNIWLQGHGRKDRSRCTDTRRFVKVIVDGMWVYATHSEWWLLTVVMYGMTLKFDLTRIGLVCFLGGFCYEIFTSSIRFKSLERSKVHYVLGSRGKWL